MRYNFVVDKFNGLLASIYQDYWETNYNKVLSIDATESHDSVFSALIQLLLYSNASSPFWVCVCERSAKYESKHFDCVSFIPLIGGPC